MLSVFMTFSVVSLQLSNSDRSILFASSHIDTVYSSVVVCTFFGAALVLTVVIKQIAAVFQPILTCIAILLFMSLFKKMYRGILYM